MHPTLFPSRFLIGQGTWPPDRRAGSSRPNGHRPWRPRCGRRQSLAALPPSVHAVPYAALAALSAAFLAPGIVPRGPVCDDGLGVAPVAERELFIHVSAAAFGVIAGLLLLSALTASAQRRASRPGVPTIAAASLTASLAVPAAISPHSGAAGLVLDVMKVDVFLPLVTYGMAFAIPLAAAVIAWTTMAGPKSSRAVQIGAWTTLLLVLPIIMALTYQAVSPICFG